MEDAKAKFKALKLLLGVNIELEDELELLNDAFEIAISNGTTIYDALYIALAKRTPNSVLITPDVKQYEICAKLGLHCTLV